MTTPLQHAAGRLVPTAIASLIIVMHSTASAECPATVAQEAPVAQAPVAQAPVKQETVVPAADKAASNYSVQTLIDDMALPNDEELKNHRQFGWAVKRHPGFNVSGPDNSQRPYLLPWYTLAEGASNNNYDVALQTRNMQVWVMSNNVWRRTHDHASIGGSYYPLWTNYFSNAQGKFSGDYVDIRRGQNLHGWWGGRQSTGSVQAVVVAVQARLDGGDASRSKYLMNVGADWYPIKSGASDVILESVGISRAKWITNDWQWVTMSTLTNVGIQEPGGGISTEQLWRNPPPIE